MRPLDIDAVQAFVLVADFLSFTRAAEACGTTQSAISLRLKRLEQRLGRRLVERSPRLVQLSAEGEAFLPKARDLLAAMERAVARCDQAPGHLVLGISDHVAGPEFPGLLGRLASHHPELALEVEVGMSPRLADEFDAGRFDAVIVRRQSGRRDGEVLFTDSFGWFTLPSWRHRPDQPFPLVSLSTVCGVRNAAARALDDAGLSWRETFVGGGTAAVAAAVMAGLGVAPLSRRIAPAGFIDAGPALGLPLVLPGSEIVLLSRVSDPRSASALRTVTAAFRGGGADAS